MYYAYGRLYRVSNMAEDQIASASKLEELRNMECGTEYEKSARDVNKIEMKVIIDIIVSLVCGSVLVG